MTAPHSQEHSPRRGEVLRKLATGVGIGTVALLAAEQISSEVFYPYWRRGGLECLPPHNNTPNKLPEECWLVVPGLKYPSGHIIATALEESLGTVAPVGFANYQNQRLGIEKLAEKAKSSGVRNLNIYGHSMGTGVAMTLLSMLQPQLESGELKVNRFVMDGSPAELNDTNYKELLETVLSLRYPPGMLAKFAMHAWDLTAGKDLRSFVQEFEASPQLLMNQLSHLEFSGPKRYQHLKPYFRDTQFAYVSGEKDIVVKTRQSLDKWQEEFDGRIHEIAIPNGIHANPHEEPQLYNKALLEWLNAA